MKRQLVVLLALCMLLSLLLPGCKSTPASSARRAVYRRRESARTIWNPIFRPSRWKAKRYG